MNYLSCVCKTAGKKVEYNWFNLLRHKRLSIDAETNDFLHSPTENSLSGVKSQDLGGHSQSPKREIRRSPNVFFQQIDCGTSCVITLRHLIGTTAPGHHDCSIQE
ncbi:hypothetical protein TNCV_819911 [Trichonephila clavipes]|nr:hypothetical protein TNCV_819911 [Trichonephila clavipes]